MSVITQLNLPSIRKIRMDNSLENKKERFRCHRSFDAEKGKQVYCGKLSFIKLPQICLGSNRRGSVDGEVGRSSNNYYKFEKIQKENNALRNFIIESDGKQNRKGVESSLDTLNQENNNKIAGMVDTYFSQLEDYVKNMQ